MLIFTEPLGVIHSNMVVLGSRFLFRYDLPPLRALTAFEAVARLGGVCRAARELGLSRWAVSYQLNTLERRLGVQLFCRNAKRLELTQAGQTLLFPVTEALDIIQTHTGALKASSNVASSPSTTPPPAPASRPAAKQPLRPAASSSRRSATLEAAMLCPVAPQTRSRRRASAPQGTPRPQGRGAPP
ncbi:MAG: transcriptional regulator GcvA [Pseudomonadota bacterium]